MGIKVECRECEKVFTSHRALRGGEVKCTGCGSYDVDLAEPCPGWSEARATA